MTKPTQAQIEAAAKAIQLKLEVYAPETSPAPWAAWQTYSVAARAALTAAAQVEPVHRFGDDGFDFEKAFITPEYKSKAAARVGEPHNMTKPTQAQIDAAAKAIRYIDSEQYAANWYLTLAEAALTAAAQVGIGRHERDMATMADHVERIEAATIERCARVAEEFAIRGWERGPEIAAAIRKLKDE